jgi:heme-degrading monooxygenase HmoA
MKLKIIAGTICLIMLSSLLNAQTNNTNPPTESKKSNKVNKYFIDKFIVPAAAKQEFTERLNINRNFIKKLAGFKGDVAYERTDEQGNLVCITIATWESEDAMKKARETVQAEYKRQGFDLPAMLERLHITMDRGLYTAMD